MSGRGLLCTIETEVIMGNKIKINLTDARPVSIDPEAWPLVAKAVDFDGQFLAQANRVWEIRVRQKGEEVIVYGWKKSEWRGEAPIYAGEITDPEGVVGAIRSVAEEIGNDDLSKAAIRDLPAEEI